jgi:FUN14 family
MIQQIQIVIKALGKQMDIEDPLCMKYADTSFQSIVWMLIFDIVTIKRNAAVLQRYENNHCITTTKLLWRCFRIMSIIESFGSIVATMGSGFFVDVLIGYALKKVIKIVAVIVGLFLAGLAYLQYHQVANIN